MTPEVQKAFGAFYTPQNVADFLTSWALRKASDTALDPSAGEGVFLIAARNRLIELGGNPGQVRGIELSHATHRHTQKMLAALGTSPSLSHSDFFDHTNSTYGSVSAIVGNPPFIRYQRFTGENRKKALDRALEAGVKLSELSSSWAPFLVHATTFIEPGGRMAVVAPAELAHAAYAQPVVRFLSESFGSVKLLVFEKRLFPDLSEDTVLVLAEGRGLPFGKLTLHQLHDAAALDLATDASLDHDSGQATSAWTNGVARFVEYFLPTATRQLYRELAAHAQVVRLGEMAEVGIGYVTGNNDFFHLSAEDVAKYQIPKAYLRKSVRNARDVEGQLFTNLDWKRLHARGDRNLLLHIETADAELDENVAAYLRTGIRSGVARAYKCRKRTPWYAVPHVYTGDAFLSYMSGQRPKLFLNRAKAAAPNTLHVVRRRPNAQVSALDLVAAWNSPLTSLSCEIEGHGMGGGMLKLEPREAARVLFPVLPNSNALVDELDKMARSGQLAALEARVDKLTCQVLGLNRSEVRRLRDATTLLRNRRTGR